MRAIISGARIRFEDRGYATACWVWRLSIRKDGYAAARVPGLGAIRVHRAAYQVYVGPIPDGLVIDHLCRVRSCCNPDHLEAVTPQENIARGIIGDLSHPL
jgi:hypothetical protein